jgi:beta-lactamase regulating signal transducer with metallopeptidase domain
VNPDLLLRVVAALAGFFLKTTLAFGVCLVFTRLVDLPNRRFSIWLSFLGGMGAYWLWLAKGVLADGQLPASAPISSVQPAASSVNAWQIPGSWAFPLGIALRVAGIVYLLALAGMLFTYIKKQWHLRWVLRFTSAPPVEIAEIFQSLAPTLGVSRSQLLVLSGVTSPATFGWIRPTILLPDACLGQDRSELEDILRHELHHIRRRDFIWNGLAILWRALLFFHPASWYAVRRMQLDRELACDLAVVSQTPARRAAYAECLIRFARMNQSEDHRTWGLDFAAAQHLKARIHSILTGSRKPSGWLICLRAACGLALLTGFLGIVPSLAVLISYAHQQISQPLSADISVSRQGTKTGVTASRKVRTTWLPASRNAAAAVASLGGAEASQPTQSTADSTDSKVGDTTPTSSGRGPALLRRPPPSAAPGNGGKQQIIALSDPSGSDQTSKSEDRNQAIQQSATAALGLYSRVSGSDRH